MKKILGLFITSAFLLVITAGAQSLAEIASQSKARQKANPNAKVIDNDVIPSAAIDVSSSSSPSADVKADATNASGDKTSADKKDTSKSEAKNDSSKQPADDEDNKKKEDLKQKIANEKKEIQQLQRELSVAQREAGVRAAVYYADAGAMLRDSARYAEDSRNLKAEIDTKTQALADAKQKLEDLQEQARKAGIPSGQVE